MNKRGMTCCCDISSGLNCTEFLKYCFNTQNPLNFPLTVRVSGTASSIQTTWACCSGPAALYGRQSGALSYSGTLTRAYPAVAGDCNNGIDTWSGGNGVRYCGDITWSCTGDGEGKTICCDPSQPDCGSDQPINECDCLSTCFTYDLQGSGRQRVMLQCGACCSYQCSGPCQCTGGQQQCCNLTGWLLNTIDHPLNDGGIVRTDTYVGACCQGQIDGGLPCRQIVSGYELITIGASGRGCAAAPCYGAPFCNRYESNSYQGAYTWPSGQSGLGPHRQIVTTQCGPLTTAENDGTFSVIFA